MPKQWTEHDYFSAISEAHNEANAPEIQEQLQQRILQYERARGSGFAGRATGIDAVEEWTGKSPADRKTRDAEQEADEPKLPKTISDETKKKFARGGSTEGSFWTARDWFEPSLEEFHRSAEKTFDVDEVAKVTEGDPAFQLWADAKWAEASDRAKKEGRRLVRVKDLPENTTGEKARKLATKVARVPAAAALGIEESGMAGLPFAAAAAIGDDPSSDEEIAQARAGSSTGRVIGNVLGMVSPFGIAAGVGNAAAKLAAPAAGKAIIKLGGGRAARALGRGAVAATGGAAGLSALGGAQEIGQGTNPFSIDFLGRRGKDALIGAGAGVGSELVGTGLAKLGRQGEIGRAQKALKEGGQLKRINPILEAEGLSPATMAELEHAPISNLLAAAITGSQIGRYALLTALMRSIPQRGEAFFKAAAKRLQSAPIAPDVAAGIEDGALTKGTEIFGGNAEVPGRKQPWIAAKPPQTSEGGSGMFGIPFTNGVKTTPRSLSKEEAEAFIRTIAAEAASAEDKESAPLEENEDSGETSSIGLLPSGARRPVHIDVTEDVPEPTTASMNARENELAAATDAELDDFKNSDAFANVVEDKDMDPEQRRLAHQKEADAAAYALRVAGPNPSPMKLFLLRTKYLIHEEQRERNEAANKRIKEDKALNPHRYKSTPKGHREAQKIKKDAQRRGFYQKPDVG